MQPRFGQQWVSTPVRPPSASAVASSLAHTLLWSAPGCPHAVGVVTHGNAPSRRALSAGGMTLAHGPIHMATSPAADESRSGALASPYLHARARGAYRARRAHEHRQPCCLRVRPCTQLPLTTCGLVSLSSLACFSPAAPCCPATIVIAHTSQGVSRFLSDGYVPSGGRL